MVPRNSAPARPACPAASPAASLPAPLSHGPDWLAYRRRGTCPQPSPTRTRGAFGPPSSARRRCAALRDRELRRPRDRRRRDRRGRRAGRGHARAAVALVEARDFASGTSQPVVQADPRRPALPRAARLRARPRGAARAGPAARPALPAPRPPGAVPYPLTQRGWERAYVGAGHGRSTTRSAATRRLQRHRHLTRRAALRSRPALQADALVGAIQYYDAQVDDARHTMSVARTAAHYGAACAANAQAVGFLREGERVTGVRVRDLETGDELEVRARQVDQRDRASGPTTCRHGRRARQVPRARVEGRPPGGAARPDQLDTGADHAHREERAVRDPVGTPLDHRHDRHRLGRSTRRTRRRASATSTTCSSTSTACSRCR